MNPVEVWHPIESEDSILSLPPALGPALSGQPIGGKRARLVDPDSWCQFGHWARE